MFHGAVLALADERGAREHDREHGDLRHDARDRGEPHSFEIGIEQGAQREVDGQRGCGAITFEEIGHLAGDDALDIAAAGEGLSYARGELLPPDRPLLKRQKFAALVASPGVRHR